MIVAVDQAALTELARREVERHPPRTPGRRAAAVLWVALADTGSVDAARRALSGFAAADVEQAALGLLGRLALQAGQEVP